MPSLKIDTVLEVQLGSELIRLERSSVRTVGKLKLERLVTLSDGNVAGSQATIFDAAVDAFMAGWTLGAILVDPEDVYADDAAVPVISVDFVGDAVSSPAFQVRRECPLIFGASGAGGPAGGGLATIDGAVTQIRVRNNNATPASGSAAIDVRFLLFK